MSGVGVGGVPPGLGGIGFGEVRQARSWFNGMEAGMERLREIEDHVESDAMNAERHIKELAAVCKDMFRATGAMFEQEHVMCAASRWSRQQAGQEQVEEVPGTPTASSNTRSSRT